MTPRLAAGIEASALIRRVQAMGGMAAVLARGDATAGALLLILAARGVPGLALERRLRSDGSYGWDSAGPQDIASGTVLDDYIDRRRAIDPDLWVIELDVADVQRFGAQLLRDS
jgi:hypothetical protein